MSIPGGGAIVSNILLTFLSILCKELLNKYLKIFHAWHAEMADILFTFFAK